MSMMADIHRSFIEPSLGRHHHGKPIREAKNNPSKPPGRMHTSSIVTCLETETFQTEEKTDPNIVSIATINATPIKMESGPYTFLFFNNT